ncbi:MAG: DUF4124 domain-containing protein [Gammaproteobacteria bacterium]|nr:DUF4124 domain-containing protein [Gammaproteobacteria bacterium]
MKRLSLLLAEGVVLGVVLGWSGLSSAEFYKCRDSGGEIHYSQLLVAGEECIPLHLSFSPPKPVQAQAGEAEKGEAVAEPKVTSDSTPSLGDLEKLYQRNCQSARYNLQVYNTAARITTADGAAKELGEQERTAKIAEAEAQIKSYCRD